MKAIAKRLMKGTSCRNGLKSRFCVILGTQYGFEGKYKMLDKLCEDYDYSIRFNGGSTNDPVQMDCGNDIHLLPYGIQKEFSTKCLVGNGVVIDPEVLLSDFTFLKRNGVDYENKTIISERCHMVTALHKEIKDKLRAARQDRIWISNEDICTAFKPLKMGLRTCILHDEPWEGFVDTYDRILKTGQQIYNVQVDKIAREKDLDDFAQLKKIFTENNDIVQDTITLLNREIRANKRCLIEDCSSTSMDIDTGIYPYTDSFNTNTGAVCTGLGIPEESIETTIGVFSAISMIDRAFKQHIKNFPTEIERDEPGAESIISKLDKRYLMPEAEVAAGWTDLNVLVHAENTNNLQSIFLTHLDLLDDLDEIKVCTGYSAAGTGQFKNRLPATIREFGQLEAKYTTLKGWKQDTRNAKTFDELPDNAQSFVKFIEQATKKEVTFVSTSADETTGMLRTRLS